MFSDVYSVRLENSGRSGTWRQETVFLVEYTLKMAAGCERASEEGRR